MTFDEVRAEGIAVKILNEAALTSRLLAVPVILAVLHLPHAASIADDDVAVDAVALAPVPAPRRIRDVEGLFFSQGMKADEFRTQLEERLDEKISSIDRRCKLSKDQREKLQLAGIRDINRTFDRVDELKKKSEIIARAPKNDAEIIEARSAFHHETARLQRMFWSDVFVSGRDALFTKTLHRILTQEQRATNDVVSLLRKRIRNVEPDRISFGEIRVGAIAEANLRIIGTGLIDPDSGADVELEGEMPSFLNDVKCHIEQHNALNQNRGTCTVSVSVSTTEPGEFQQTLMVLIGDDLFAEIPITASILPREVGQRRLLVVETPFHSYSVDDASRFDPWLDVARSAKIDVNYLDVERRKPVLRDLDLSRFDVILLAESGVFNAIPDDFERLVTFAESGGRVIVAASAHYDGSVAKANAFISRFGIAMENAEVDRERTIEIESSGIADHELTINVDALKFFRPSAVSLMGSSQGRMLVAAPSIPNSGFVAAVKVGKGSVIVLGTSLWWKWIASDREKCPGNAMLLKNLICQP